MANNGTKTASKDSLGISNILNKISGHNDIIFAIGIVGILAVLLFPIPTLLLDFLLTISITISIVILLTVIFINKSLEFNSFPTILLIAAVFRLSLNIGSTRLILSEGHSGPDAAGEVINAFGNFVMAGSVVIGSIIFIILTIINFVVITKGSGRIAEVSARFSLDAMPGKQMAIDADLSAGLIDEEEAKTRRKDLEDESAFYGAMDGANKFVRGDAIAGLMITFINFIAGIIIGIVQRDMSFNNAIETYTILTIGDGLVSQIPSILVSTAAGLLVTKSGITGSADKAVLSQLSNSYQALFVASGLLFFLGTLPGLPLLPFTFMSIFIGVMGFYVYNKSNNPAENSEQKLSASANGHSSAVKNSISGNGGSDPQAAATMEDEPINKTLAIDSLSLEIGYGLLPLINYQKGHKLPDQIRALRTQLAKNLGFVMPSVRIQDNMSLESNEYVIKVKNIECGQGTIKPEMILIMNPTGGKIDIAGEDTKEPAFGLPAKWVADSNRESALFKNYTVVDPPTVITTHLTEIIKDNITELLSYTATQKLLDAIDEEYKKLISDVIPSQLSVGSLQRVLQNLLSENVSIRDLPTILEAISEAVSINKNIRYVTEHIRSRLSKQICHANAINGVIPVVSLSTEWEQIFAEGLVGNEDDKQLAVAPSKLQEFIVKIRKVYDKLAMQGEIPILLTSPSIRPYLRSIIERFRPQTVVLSQNEIHTRAKIKTVGQV
ncbi:MAG: flagellar biosynthesis protein FlhA [Pseudomonadota bacterium]